MANTQANGDAPQPPPAPPPDVLARALWEVFVLPTVKKEQDKPAA